MNTFALCVCLSLCSVMFSQPQVLQTMEGLQLPKGLGFLAAVTPWNCFALSRLQTQSIVLSDRHQCELVWHPLGHPWASRLLGWDTEEPCPLSCLGWWSPAHAAGGWKASNRVITLHCCWGEGTSAATKDVVHLTPLASSHVLGIVSHLAAFCSYLTEMHPFEKIQSLEIACHAMNHCKSSMSKTLVLINLCFSVYAVYFPLWLKPRGWNYFPK